MVSIKVLAVVDLLISLVLAISRAILVATAG